MLQKIEQKLDGILRDFANVYGVIDRFNKTTQKEIFDYFKIGAELYSNFAFDNNIDAEREHMWLENSRLKRIVEEAPESCGLFSVDFSKVIEHLGQDYRKKWLDYVTESIDVMSILKSGVKVGAPTKVFFERNGKDSRHIFFEPNGEEGIRVLDFEKELFRPDCQLVICDDQVGCGKNLRTTVNYLVHGVGYCPSNLFIHLPGYLVEAKRFRKIDLGLW